MALDPLNLPAAATDFLAERHLATLTTLRADGRPHVVPVGFSWDGDRQLARIITRAGSVKVANIAHGGRAVLCQVDRGRWLSLEGQATVHDEADLVAEAERRYTERYQPPRPASSRVTIHVAVDRVLGRVG